MKFFSFNILNPWESLRGKVCKVQLPDGHIAEYVNLKEFINHLRGRSFQVLYTGPKPDRATAQSKVEANPADSRARLALGAQFLDTGELDAAYREFQEAISLLSNDQGAEDDSSSADRTLPFDRRLAERAFARYFAATALEQMGREEEAREQWQGCADDYQDSLPTENKKYLSENSHYLKAIEKLGKTSME
jgi:tetratricopeptide (TPR) repeat protein